MYIVTVVSNKGEIVCSYEEREQCDPDTRLLLDKSKREWQDWIKERKRLFPESVYRIYRLTQVEIT